MTFLSLDLRSKQYTFLNSEGRAITLSPQQVFNWAAALDALPLDQQTLLARNMTAAAIKSA